MKAIFVIFLLAHGAMPGCAPPRVPKPEEAKGSGPGRRYGHELVYDEAREEVVLFGGFGSDGKSLSDTWTWNGDQWKFMSHTGPSPRKWSGAAYDSKRHQIVLFGGREGAGGGGASLNDTWVWSDEKWSLKSTTGPSGRDHHRMAYDRMRDRIVLFGGWDGSKVLGDTWEWDGRKWYLISEEGPDPRTAYGLAFHEIRGTIVLFGGRSLERTYGDTWLWDGVKWKQVETEGPTPRTFHGMTYDAGKAEVLMFSGRDGNRLFNELWSWDGGNWTLLDQAGPVRRGVYALSYDRKRRLSLFHGSGIRLNGEWQLEMTTWAWDGHNWMQVSAGED